MRELSLPEAAVIGSVILCAASLIGLAIWRGFANMKSDSAPRRDL
jgi:hypothetical protein